MVFESVEDLLEQFPPGWREISRALAEVFVRDQIEVFQVKEKFGGLRVYIGSALEEVHRLIDNVEAKSFHVCEVCGASGELRNDLSWVLTLCEEHYEERLAQGWARRNKD